MYIQDRIIIRFRNPKNVKDLYLLKQVLSINMYNLLQVREIYTKCALECVTDTPAFKDCMQLLKFQSQMKLVESIKSALKIVNSYLQAVSPVRPLRSSPSKNNLNNLLLNNDLGENFAKSLRVHLLTFLRQIEHANTDTSAGTNDLPEIEKTDENVPGNRYKLKEVRALYYLKA